MTPLLWIEFSESDLLIEDAGSMTSTFVVVRAVVVFGGLITNGREDSARIVMLELLETLRRFLSNAGVDELLVKSDSEGRVEREGGIDIGGSALVRSG